MRPELPTAVAVDNSASIQPARSIFISWGKSVQISGATSHCGLIEIGLIDSSEIYEKTQKIYEK